MKKLEVENMTAISYVYADLIEASVKTGVSYKTIGQVPEKLMEEVKIILTERGIDINS